MLDRLTVLLTNPLYLAVAGGAMIILSLLLLLMPRLKRPWLLRRIMEISGEWLVFLGIFALSAAAFLMVTGGINFKAVKEKNAYEFIDATVQEIEYTNHREECFIASFFCKDMIDAQLTLRNEKTYDTVQATCSVEAKDEKSPLENFPLNKDDALTLGRDKSAEISEDGQVSFQTGLRDYPLFVMEKDKEITALCP